MTGFGYDPELPDGFQEADFEMRDLEAAGARADAMRRAGKCPHSSIGPRTPNLYLVPESVTCSECGQTFDSVDAWMEASI